MVVVGVKFLEIRVRSNLERSGRMNMIFYCGYPLSDGTRVRVRHRLHGDEFEGVVYFNRDCLQWHFKMKHSFRPLREFEVIKLLNGKEGIIDYSSLDELMKVFVKSLKQTYGKDGADEKEIKEVLQGVFDEFFDENTDILKMAEKILENRGYFKTHGRKSFR